jgi:hypothetical protein
MVGTDTKFRAPKHDAPDDMQKAEVCLCLGTCPEMWLDRLRSRSSSYILFHALESTDGHGMSREANHPFP